MQTLRRPRSAAAALLGTLLLALGLAVGPARAAVADGAPPDPAAAPAAVPVPAELQAAAAAGPTDVLVSYDTATAVHQLRASSIDGAATAAGLSAARSAFGALKRASLAVHDGLDVVRDFAHLPVQLVRVSSPAALRALAADPGVAAITPNPTYRLDATANLEVIDQPEALAAGAGGAGTAVAVFDTGVAPGSDSTFGSCGAGAGAACRIDYSHNVNGTSFQDLDPGRHGTNVASIVARVAPQAHLWVYGVFHVEGGELVTDGNAVLTALEDLLQRAPAGAVRAINLSVGDPNSRSMTPCSASPLASTFATLRGAGIVPVVAAGNNAYSTGSFQAGLPDPACAPGAVSVGAVYSTSVGGTAAWGPRPDCIDTFPSALQITCFSQVSPQLSILAPGTFISGGGTTESGTSQAAPHVAGAVAALASCNPSATAQNLVDALTSSGQVINDTRTSPATGKPLLDVDAALSKLPRPCVPRLGGTDRIATSVLASHASFPDPSSAGAVVLASSEAFPDGLAGTPLARSVHAPLLLTSRASLRSDVRAEILRILPTGGTVYLLGGSAALDPSVDTALSAAGYRPVRLQGTDRYGTAVAIADALPNPSQVLLATGRNFPDALAAGVAAAHVGGAVLFTQDTTQAPITQAWLDAHPSVPRVIVGGTADGTAPGALRIIGVNRYDTAAKVAQQLFGNPTIVGIASGEAFPDALSGGAHLAQLGAPILLAPQASVPDYTVAYLGAHKGSIGIAYLYGGSAAITSAADGQVRAATAP
jgi:putative cell wall-binding protein